MNNKKLLEIICLALIVNAFLLGIIAFKGCGFRAGSVSNTPVDSMAFPEWRQNRAAAVARRLVCENLYYPNSYSLADLRVDSLFYGYMTDPQTVKSAIQLIDAQTELRNAEGNVESSNNTYLEAQNTLKVFGSSGVFWRHRKDRDEALENLNSAKERLSRAKEDVEQLKETIRSRDTLNDGKYVGWQVYCRYRAQTNNGTISFGSNVFLLDSKMQNCVLRYSLDEGDKDLDDIKQIIESTLEMNTNDSQN